MSWLFIHLGEDVVIRSKDVVGIIDRQLVDSATIINEFLEGQQEQDNIIKITDEGIKSIVITTEKVYFSPLSSATLKRRSQMISELDLYVENEDI